MHMAVIARDPGSDRSRHWTAAELHKIPDDRNRYEIIDGELFVTPAPAFGHQKLLGDLFAAVRCYTEAHPSIDVMLSPADIELADDTVVQPDLFVISLPDGGTPRSWADIGPLLLAIEILSPSTARVDRTLKRRRYQREGIPEYWIVDGDARVVERWRPHDERPEIVTEQLEWRPEAGVTSLVIDLATLFSRALGE